MNPTEVVADIAPASDPIEPRATGRSDGGSQPVAPSLVDRWGDTWRWPVVRIATFIVCTVILAFPRLDRLHTSIVGDPGDAYLILSLLEWGGDRSVDLFQGFWSGPMFASGDNAMAYSDSLLPLAFP
ncbi:MAG TPA: hypothetical protein VMM60_12085, partial [Ilumatobacter sp.]|nr:hypothetical protein [Ilumatobacter sp.]